MEDTEEFKLPESPSNEIEENEDTISNNKNPVENLIETSLEDMPAEPESIVSDSESPTEGIALDSENTNTEKPESLGMLLEEGEVLRAGSSFNGENHISYRILRNC